MKSVLKSFQTPPAALALATAFRRSVIAEGVETAAHGELLLTLGCELAQGYGIARPMPAHALPLWVQAWRPDASWTAWRERSLSRGDKAVVFVEVGHRHWLRCLEAFVQGERPAPPALDASDCHFGRWQVAEGLAVYGKNPAFQRLIDLHEEIHRHAQHVVHLTHSGQGNQARAELPALRRALSELADMLRDLVRLEAHW